MLSVATGYEYIVISDKGVAIIEGTTTKVIELVLETMSYGWGPEELRLQHPYFSCRRDSFGANSLLGSQTGELDRDIERRLGEADLMRQKYGKD